jgi:hypothetical protein
MRVSGIHNNTEMAKESSSEQSTTKPVTNRKSTRINQVILAFALVFLALTALSARNALNEKLYKAYEGLGKLAQALENRLAVLQNSVTLLRAYEIDIEAEMEGFRQARGTAAVADNLEEKLKAEAQITKQVELIYAAAEAKYDFSGDFSFLKAKKQLRMTADDLKRAKELADGGLRFYNSFAAGFPQNLMARWMGLPARIQYTDPFPPREADKGGAADK